MAPIPQINEVCKVSIGGFDYTYWTEMEFERAIGPVLSTCWLTTAELSSINPAAGFSNIQLMVGRKAQVSLAGQIVITGTIDVRQVVYDGQAHYVKIRIASNTGGLVASTTDHRIDGQGGQFLNQPFSQIATVIGNNVGVNIITSDPSNIPFERVSVQPGQMRSDFLNTLAVQRNLYPVDNPYGELTYSQMGLDGSGLSLVEGENIFSARVTLRNDFLVEKVDYQGAGPGTDPANGSTVSQVEATAYNSAYTGGPRPYVVMSEHTTTVAEAQLRANAEMAHIALTAVEAEITVQGWLCSDGKIWERKLGKNINLISPMILPVGSQGCTLGIQAVKHIQSNEKGTITILTLVLPNAIGGGILNYNPGTGAGLIPGSDNILPPTFNPTP